MGDDDKGSGSSGSGSCIGCVLTVFVLWALFFGITIGSTHYGVVLDCDRGVVIEETP